MPTIAPSTKERIVLTAERLFAQHGLDGVSLRQIAAAAGSGNNSVVSYHFGSQEQLVDAVLEYRLPRLHARRSLLIDERRPDDLRGWVEIQVRAVLEQSELEGSHYMGFIARLYQHGIDLWVHLPEEYRAASNEYFDRLGSFLPHIIEPLRSRRLSQAMALIVHVAADRERARAEHHPVFPFAVEVGDLVDSMVGFLEAPVSAASLAALHDADLSAPRTPNYL